MRILMVSAEAPPLQRAGALVDVMNALPHELRNQGHEISIALPYYREIRESASFQAEETGYQQIQGTKPQTLGVALNDSPVGLAAWIVEKFRAWCDCDGNPDKIFTKDELLTNITLYWVTQTAASSARIYYESRHPTSPANARKIEVPTACADFPKEIIWSPRSYVALRYNLVRWTPMPKGGHFAAFEQPELLVTDVRAFFRQIRGGLANQEFRIQN